MTLTVEQRLATLAKTNPKAVKLFAVWCARQALVHTDDWRVVNCVNVTERYIHGMASRQTLDDAAWTASDAATEAADADAVAAWAADASAAAAAYAAWAAYTAWAAKAAAWAANAASAADDVIQAQEAKLTELEGH